MDIINTEKRAQGRASCSLFPVDILSKLCAGLQKPAIFHSQICLYSAPEGEVRISDQSTQI